MRIPTCRIAGWIVLAAVVAAGCTEGQRPAPAPAGPIIFHITTRQAWAEAVRVGRYEPEDLRMYESIPCSVRSQVIGVANEFFKDRKGLVLLYIDSAKVRPEIRYVDMDGTTPIGPHIYGPLDVAAVVRVADFTPQADGKFVMPPEVGGPKK